jgi:hypothetical protein
MTITKRQEMSHGKVRVTLSTGYTVIVPKGHPWAAKQVGDSVA